jgi:hypothetical protein
MQGPSDAPRQHTSSYASIRQDTSTYVIIRQHTSEQDELRLGDQSVIIFVAYVDRVVLKVLESFLFGTCSN